MTVRDKSLSVAELLELVRALPEPTPREREQQALSFAYGNLAASTNHKPSRAAFAKLASERYGWSEWAADLTWPDL